MLPLRIVLAWIHLLALGVGLAGVWSRARALRDSQQFPDDRRAILRALIGDAWWGIAALFWLVSGVWRLVAGTEKATSYYMTNDIFLLKMALFASIAALEVWPMVTLIKWRTGKLIPTPRDVGRIEVISYVEVALVVAMVLAAVSMARGYGVRGGPIVPPARVSGVTVDKNPTLAASSTPQNDASDALVGVAEESARVPAPSGSEMTTAEDVALLAREIAMPIAGIDPARLHDSFNDVRGGGSRKHEALDIMSPRRTPVLAAARGRVLKLFNSKAGGLMVYAADSSERFIMLYGHLDGYAPGLRDGAPLTRGQLIGYVGSTGNAQANAPHLHFGVPRSADVKKWSKGTPIDPLPILKVSAQRR